ncbi:DUF5701 family protein [Catellatospora sp. NPDC049609]|uniref:DUF5701 family protein n=1 Tax=Catellatospora sp. NPDC049609 TaxID=3155505 RepID=UPI00341EC629
MPTMLAPLPSLAEQAQRLIELELHHHAGLSESDVRGAARAVGENALLVINADRVAASVLAPMMRHRDRQGFVVEDMTDLDAFTPIEVAATPDAPLYLVHDVTRGDEMANWSPDEALPALTSAGRTPLTVAEGIHWLLQQPEALERNHCFMTIGSRLRRPDGRLDARTPALWLSNGTGRDGAARRHAPKVGWCWAGNRHTWLGFASASRRSVA